MNMRNKSKGFAKRVRLWTGPSDQRCGIFTINAAERLFSLKKKESKCCHLVTGQTVALVYFERIQAEDCTVPELERQSATDRQRRVNVEVFGGGTPQRNVAGQTQHSFCCRSFQGQSGDPSSLI